MKNIKVGTIAYAAHSGLGNLAKDFYDNGLIDEVLICRHLDQGVVDGIYPDNTPVITTKFNYPGEDPPIGFDPFVRDYKDVFLNFFKKIDVLFLFETAFWRNVWRILKDMDNRPKIILMPMYESTPKIWNEHLGFFPDMLLCPSKLDFNFYKHYKWGDSGVVMHCINVPVAVPWKQRTKAVHFIHNGGNESYFDRNGTRLLIDSLPHIKSPIKLTINTQTTTNWTGNSVIADERVSINVGTRKYEDLWIDGDVFIFPERFNALSLPLNEARAAGMYIIAGNRFPINKWLPHEGLIPVKNYRNIDVGNGPVACAYYNATDLANKIDEIYNTNITQYSKGGLEYAKKNSWEYLKPRYEEYIQSVINE